ncbi:uncharacterized protein LOC111781580 isoform X1 [Cucurbita pepo subsp. pepo]|uniref:uncharacterized protein LOC111781580 isoform X1 n=2 Tax=Cucurbita pepo subsp. pepo TaxID=3664 RepID=UPI000C9D9645|nr:uncharacterized protein LOC111781580 isoform X1 [Cucurbita pepo subsp. pepo]XP_023518019.1 uncharacterized protein LOC111781580 isoform X1 [Cucurbita pepo subsp. pepo]
MDQEAHFCRKFTNMKSHWDLDQLLGDANQVGEFHAANNLPNTYAEVAENSFRQNRGLHLGNLSSECKSQGSSRSDADAFGISELSAAMIMEAEYNDTHVERGFTHDLCAGTNSSRVTPLEGSICDTILDNRNIHKLVNLSSECKSQGSSRSDTDAFGISELSAAMIMETEFNNTHVERGFTHDLCAGLRTNSSRVTPHEGSICDTILDNRSIHKFNTNESFIENRDLSDENVKGDIVASKLVSCSRERRLRKPTRRFIEEFSDSKSESNKGRKKTPTKDKYMKGTSTEESSHVSHEVQVSTPKSEWHCGTSVPVQSRSQRRHPKKHVPVSGFLSEDVYSATECKNVYSSAKRCKKHDRRKHQKMWTLTEVMQLVDGIAEYGTGRWTHIKRHLFAHSPHRTPIDLRDKWRNLLRASCVNIQNRKGIERKQSHASRPLPKSLLQRVYELANIYPYPKERSPKSVEATTPAPDLTESNALPFNWGRKKDE